MANSTSVVLSPFLEFGAAPVHRSGVMLRPVFNSSSGAVHLLPEALALKLLRNERLRDAELTAVRQTGIAVDTVIESRSTVLGEIVEATDDPGKRGVALLPTSFCNMACSYCGQEHRRGTYSPSHRDSVVERLVATGCSPMTTSLAVRWFGGEPLMGYAQILDISRRVIPRVVDSGVEYSAKIITNGVLLDERKLAALTSECRVSIFNITLDGPEEIHDRHRPLKSGKGSYARIRDFLSWAAKQEQYQETLFHIRTNIDRSTAHHVSQYLSDMAQADFGGRTNVIFDLRELHNWGNGASDMNVESSEFAAREIEWFREMGDLGLNYALLPRRRRGRLCSAVSVQEEVIETGGNVFSCTEQPLVPQSDHEFVATIDSLVGSSGRPRGKFDSWNQELAEGQHACSTCSLLPVCGGQCPKLWKEGVPACPSWRRNIRERVTLFALRNDRTLQAAPEDTA